MDNIRPFKYEEHVFDQRMKDIYDDCADFAFTYEAEEGTREPYDPNNVEPQSVFPHARKRHRTHSPAHSVQFPGRRLVAEYPSGGSRRRGECNSIYDHEGGAWRRRGLAEPCQHLSRPLPLIRVLSAADGKHCFRLRSTVPRCGFRQPGVPARHFRVQQSLLSRDHRDVAVAGMDRPRAAPHRRDGRASQAQLAFLSDAHRDRQCRKRSWRRRSCEP